MVNKRPGRLYKFTIKWEVFQGLTYNCESRYAKGADTSAYYCLQDIMHYHPLVKQTGLEPPEMIKDFKSEIEELKKKD